MQQIIDKMKSNTKSLICLASGDTPLGAFKYIVDKFENKDLTNDNFVFVGLDEWVGMDKNDKGSCQEYMDEYLFRLGLLLISLFSYYTITLNINQIIYSFV